MVPEQNKLSLAKGEGYLDPCAQFADVALTKADRFAFAFLGRFHSVFSLYKLLMLD